MSYGVNNFRGVRETRISKRITVEEFAGLLSISIEETNNYEDNQKDIPVSIAKRMSQVLGVSIDCIDFNS